MDGRDIGAKFSVVDLLPRCHSRRFPWFRASDRLKHQKQQETSSRTTMCKISGVLGLYTQSLWILFLCSMDDGVLLCIPMVLPFIVWGILLCVPWPSACLFVRLAGLFFTSGFPPVCLGKVLTDLPSSASSAPPDVKAALLRSDLDGLRPHWKSGIQILNETWKGSRTVKNDETNKSCEGN